MDRRVDLALAVASVALGAVILVLTLRISTALVIDPVGSRGFGYVIAAALIVGGSVLAGRRIGSWDRRATGHVVPSEGAPDEPSVPASPARPLVVAGATLIYAWLLTPLGFLLATPLYLASLMTLLRARHPVRSRVVIPALFTVVVYLVFAQGLQVNLPVGPFRGLFLDWGLINL